MAYSLKFLLLLISLSFPVRSQLDKFTYSGFSDADSNITSIGVAEIEKNGMIRLTNDTRRLIGQAFYSSPVRFKLSKNGSVFSFSSSFAFSIVPEYPKLGGHGLAFVISPSKGPTGLPSQYFGLLNASDAGNFSNHLFAVEFDTVQDFEFGDINDNHVGIDVNSLHSNASAAAAYYDDDSRKHSLNLKSARTIQAWVDYDSVEKVINVTISPFSRKPRIALLSFKMDMSPIFHEFMYVGFSSSTGLLASSHYLFGWSFNVNGEAQSLDLRSLPTLPAPKKNHTALTTGVTVVSVVLFVLAILAALFLIRKIKNADLIEAWELDIGPHRFSYKELKKATKGFRDKELLGHGGFGRVYKGTLPNSKTQVAVKRISHESRQGLREFVSEIASIGRLRHRNLVQLLGWCRRRGDLLIVYDFMANRSLDKFLFEEPKSVLSWEQRFKIIKGVASGLLYLHEGYEQVVIHRDIKASNVLLDSDMNGRLGDFGLARIYEHGENPSTTRVVGTLGYLAPELSRTGKANTGSDVFSFGALLLEVVCGRKPVEPKAKLDELVLVDWVWDMWGEGRLLDVVDPRLEGVFDESQVVMVLKLGLMCSNNSPAARPGMRQVVSYLEGEAEMPEVLRVPSGFNERKGEFEGFDSSMHSRSFASSLDNGFASLTASPLSLLSGRGGSR